jgi:hypothetical protein
MIIHEKVNSLPQFISDVTENHNLELNMYLNTPLSSSLWLQLVQPSLQHQVLPPLLSFYCTTVIIHVNDATFKFNEQ